MPTRSSVGRVCAALFAVASLVLAGCGETTQTVGRTKAEVDIKVATGSTSAEGGRSAAGATPATTSANAAASPSKGSAGKGSPKIDAGTIDSGVVGTNIVAPPLLAPACSGLMPATRRQLELYLMVDTNITIPLSGAWDNVRSGLTSYVDDRCSTGIHAAVRYFGIDCNAAGYAMPTTPMGPLPQNAAAIKQQIPLIAFTVSPTLPALQGALMYSQARVVADPESRQAVVLVSDGFADYFCQGPTAIDSALASSVQAAPSVSIYVLALDAPNLLGAFNPGTRFDALDSIAKAGKTGTARHIDLQAKATDFAKAMVGIQHDAQSCDYAVPDAVRSDPSSMALAAPDRSGTLSPLPLVAAASACDSAGGYYFPDPSGPAWTTLCPTTCDDIKTRCLDAAWVMGCKAP